MNRFMRHMAATVLCVAISGCALGERVQKIASSIIQADTVIKSRHDNFARAIGSQEARRAAQDVGRPWLAGRAQPLARELTLPAGHSLWRVS